MFISNNTTPLLSNQQRNNIRKQLNKNILTNVEYKNIVSAFAQNNFNFFKKLGVSNETIKIIRNDIKNHKKKLESKNISALHKHLFHKNDEFYHKLELKIRNQT